MHDIEWFLSIILITFHLREVSRSAYRHLRIRKIKQTERKHDPGQ
jgi:hypothetical protein